MHIKRYQYSAEIFGSFFSVHVSKMGRSRTNCVMYNADLPRNFIKTHQVLFRNPINTRNVTHKSKLNSCRNNKHEETQDDLKRRNRIERVKFHNCCTNKLPFLSTSAGSEADAASPTTQSNDRDDVLACTSTALAGDGRQN